MRRTAAGVLASALALTGAVAAPANAAAGFALDRVAGDNRYETSARIAEAFGASTGAILASGEPGRSVDALSANFLAGVQGVPVLLTQRDRVPASVMARLNALTGARTVTIVGGTVAVSAAVETQLRGMGFAVTRLGGADRYATSEQIITAGRAAASPIGLVASGQSFPDALAGAPLSYKGKHPVFLTAGGALPQDTIDAMVAAGTRQVILLGGTAAVPASVEAALVARGIAVVTRLGGAGRSETSRIVADYLIDNHGFTNTTFNLASGTPRGEGADALSGGALSGKQNRVLLITDTASSAAPVVAFARDRSSTLNAAGTIFGGPAAVAVALEEAVELVGRTAGNFQSLNVTPSAAVTLQLADEAPAGTATVRNADNRTYTVSGLSAGTRYRITLVNAASISATGTPRTFLSSPIAGSTTAFGVDVGADIADLVSVNGTTPTNNGAALDAAARTATAVPVNGSITFEIDGTALGTVVPAVYVDAGQGGTATTGGTDVRLETSATTAGAFAAATETFGLGGPTTFVGAADTTSPQATATTRTVDGGLSGILDVGDTFTVRANEALAAPAAGSILRVQDADGTVVDLVCGTSATCALNAEPIAATPAGPNAGAAAGTVLTVTVTAAPTVIAAGTTAGLQYVNATITNTGGINDVAGNRLDIAAGDRVIDAAAAAPTALTATGTARDTNSNGTFEDGDPFVITFSEPVNPAGVNSTAVTLRISDVDGTTGTITCGSDCTLTNGNTVLGIPNGGFPAGTTGAGGTNGFQGNLQVTATTGLVAADDGAAVAVPFTLNRVTA